MKYKTVKLNDIVNIDIGKTPSRNNPKYWDKNKEGNNVWLSIKDLSQLKKLHVDDSKEYISNEGAKLFKEVPKNTLIMSFKLSIGKLAITKINLRTNEAIAAFKIKDTTLVSNEYLYYFLSSMNWDVIAGHDIKVKGKTLNKAKLKEILIMLPSLAKQQSIVAKLDAALAEIDKGINAAKYKQNKADSLKKNILAKKFELDSDVIKLGDLCEVITKGTTPTSLGYKFIDKGINFIKIESINDNGNFIKTKFAYINKDCNAALMRSQLQAGDILFSIAGALGRTAIVTEEILPANTNQALAILRIKKDIKVDKKFLLHCLNSDAVKKQSDTFKGGVAQQNLSLSQLKSYNIPFPSLLEQKDIAAKLDLIFTEMHKLKNFTKTQIKNYQALNYATLTKELLSEAA